MSAALWLIVGVMLLSACSTPSTPPASQTEQTQSVRLADVCWAFILPKQTGPVAYLNAQADDVVITQETLPNRHQPSRLDKLWRARWGESRLVVVAPADGGKALVAYADIHADDWMKALPDMRSQSLAQLLNSLGEPQEVRGNQYLYACAEVGSDVFTLIANERNRLSRLEYRGYLD